MNMSWRGFHNQTLRRKGRQTFHFMLNLCMVDGLKYSVLTGTVNSRQDPPDNSRFFNISFRVLFVLFCSMDHGRFPDYDPVSARDTEQF